VKLSGVAASALAQQLQPSEINNLLELQSTSAGTTTPSSSSYRFISLSSLFSSLCPAGSVFNGAVWTRMFLKPRQTNFRNSSNAVEMTSPAPRHETLMKRPKTEEKIFFWGDFRCQSSLWLIVCIYPHLWSF